MEDHAKALWTIVRKGRPGQKYNVGGRNERTNLEVVKTICSILDGIFPDRAPHEKLITFVDDRPGHDMRYAIDAGKLEAELEWRAEHNFDTGIAATVQWYLENDWWWKPLLQKYNGQRLGVIK